MKFDYTKLSPQATFMAGVGGAVVVLGALVVGILFKDQLPSWNSDKTAEAVVNPSAVQKEEKPANIQLAAITDQDYYKGGKDAKVTIVEFSDTECPFCKRFHDTMNQAMAKYGDNIKWVYKHSPLDSLHKKARKEAVAAECAGDIGGNKGFWKFLDTLFEVTPSNDGLAESELSKIAQKAGLDVKKFNTCLASDKYSAKVQNQLEEAEKAGMRGTPYAIIVAGDQKIPVSGALPLAQLSALIDPLLKN